MNLYDVRQSVIKQSISGLITTKGALDAIESAVEIARIRGRNDQKAADIEAIKKVKPPQGQEDYSWRWAKSRIFEAVFNNPSSPHH